MRHQINEDIRQFTQSLQQFKEIYLHLIQGGLIWVKGSSKRLNVVPPGQMSDFVSRNACENVKAVLFALIQSNPTTDFDFEILISVEKTSYVR